MEKEKICILNILGGGIRGIIPLVVLSKLENLVEKYEKEQPTHKTFPFIRKFDIISGTSTGAIIALLLNVPKTKGSFEPKYSPSEVLNIYKNEIKHIFPKNRLRNIYSCKGLLFPMYSTDGLSKIAKKYFGDTYLSESIGNVIVTGYEIEKALPLFFKSTDAKNDISKDYKMCDLAIASSSAPTYFKPYKLLNKLNQVSYIVDAGIVINNPAMISLIDAKNLFEKNKHLVISLGTGKTNKSISYKSIKNKGGVGWVFKLIPVMMNGVSNIVHEQLNDFLTPEISDGFIRPNYYQFQPIIDEKLSSMDNSSKQNIKRLIDTGEILVEDNIEYLELIVIELCNKNLNCETDKEMNDLYSIIDSSESNFNIYQNTNIININKCICRKELTTSNNYSDPDRKLKLEIIEKFKNNLKC